MRFGAFAAVVLGGVAVRLASGIGLVDAGFGVPGAIFASTLAAGFSLVLGLWLIGMRGVWPARTIGTHESVRGDLRVALYALLGFWLIAQADIALARHYLEPEEAGFYSSAGLLARALLVLPAAVALVAFPRFVSARERGEGAAHWLRASVVAGGALVLAGFVFLVPIRGFLVELTFGERYAPAAELMPLLCLAMAAFGLVGLLTYFHIAMRSKAYVIALGGLVAEIVLVAFFHSNGEEIAAVVTGVALAVLVAEYAAARSLSRWRPPRERLARSSVVPLELEPSLEVSIVLPCHNAARGLRAMLEGLVTELEAVESYEIIVVSDGSTDETVAIAQEFAPAGARVIDYPERAGKGHALQVGLTEARGRYVAFVDADGDIGAEAIGPFLAIMGLYEPDIVLGSKRHPLSEVEYPPLRRLMSWSYHKLTRVLFRGERPRYADGYQARSTRRARGRAAAHATRSATHLISSCSSSPQPRLQAGLRGPGAHRLQVRQPDWPRDPSLRIAIDTAAIFYRHYVLGSYAADGPASRRARARSSPATRASGNGRRRRRQRRGRTTESSGSSS